MENTLTKQEILFLITTLYSEIENINQTLNNDDNVIFIDELNEEKTECITIREKLIQYHKNN